jgi:hypothetical protein
VSLPRGKANACIVATIFSALFWFPQKAHSFTIDEHVILNRETPMSHHILTRQWLFISSYHMSN